jgi:proton-translocating NAD(P)+ transhydrogenase subunit alpha
VDVAAETGGNCELTVPGETVIRHNVSIVGPVNLPSSLPLHASQMYSRNVQALLLHLIHEGELVLDFEDEITRETCVAHGGRVTKEVAT